MSGEERRPDAGRPCEECGAGADGGTACTCEAEGFGPLRVRPYVTLPEPSQPPPPRAPDPYAHPPLPPELPKVEVDDDAEPPHPGDASRRPPVLLLAAIAGVLSVAALVTVLISSGDGDTSAAAQEAGTPLAATASAPSGRAPSPSASATERTAQPSSPPVSRAASAPAAPSASAPSSSPTPSPTRPASTSPRPSASASVSPTPRPSRPQRQEPQVLRRGDRGPEVGELQYRLRKVNLYPADPDGRFDSRTEFALRTYQMARGVQQDDPGTYGPATRRLLEAETR
ncbi:peptidoglycan-binding protein [Streptomyces sp. NPDC016845]|uniref:peptidoglycan-binding domain-containing protein n=1 Tax=Streptomyces sp. NPDC016845 TaxID=3364972 RepID=UPI003794FC92